jgi:hypothetical protein
VRCTIFVRRGLELALIVFIRMVPIGAPFCVRKIIGLLLWLRLLWLRRHKFLRGYRRNVATVELI